MNTSTYVREYLNNIFYESYRKTIEKKQLTDTNLPSGDVRLITPFNLDRASQARYGGSALRESEEYQMGKVNYESSVGTGGDQDQTRQGLMKNTTTENKEVSKKTLEPDTAQRSEEKKYVCEESPGFVQLGVELDALA